MCSCRIPATHSCHTLAHPAVAESRYRQGLSLQLHAASGHTTWVLWRRTPYHFCIILTKPSLRRPLRIIAACWQAQARRCCAALARLRQPPRCRPRPRPVEPTRPCTTWVTGASCAVPPQLGKEICCVSALRHQMLGPCGCRVVVGGGKGD